MENKELAPLQVGDKVSIWLVTNCIISGIVLERNEILTDNGVTRYYTIGFGGSRKVELLESDIHTYIVFDENKKSVYLKELEEKYGVKCFDSEGNMIDNSPILGRVIYDGIWEKFTDEDKQKFVDVMGFSNKNIIELINIWCMNKQELEKYHSYKMKVLDAGMEFMDNYKNYKELFPFLESAYKILFKDMGFGKVIKEISN